MFCPQCGSANDDSVKFCKMCTRLQITSRKMVYFKEAISLAFNNYANFQGRATRAEYWWFILLWASVSVPLSIIGFLGTDGFFINIVKDLHLAWDLITFIPFFSLIFRRFHDINKSGFWVIVAIGGLFGFIILFLLGAGGVGTILLFATWGVTVKWFVQPSDKGRNNYSYGEID